MYHIFPHYLIKGMIFRKKLLNMNCEFWWSHLFLFETFFHSKKNIARYCHKYRRSAPARLLRSWVRIPPGAWIVVCCVLSGRGSCDELITRTEESYRLYCVVVCDLEISRMRRSWPALGRSATGKKKYLIINFYFIDNPWNPNNVGLPKMYVAF